MALWRLYYHLVWATRERLPLIASDCEHSLYEYIVGKAGELECVIHAIGGTENHLHLVASIPPKLAVAQFASQIKGSCAHRLTHPPTGPGRPFGWQGGYGVFSLGGKQLGEAVAYVTHQKEHHQQATIIPALEQPG